MLQYTGYSNTMIGILTPLLIATTPPTPNQWIQDLRNWEAEQNRKGVEIVIDDSLLLLNNTLMEQEDGSDGSTESEELLQLPSDGDSKSP